MKTKLIFGLILATFCLILTGCGESAESRVQSMAFNNNPALTTAQALNNRKVCESTSWKSFTDDRDRTVVEYHCRLKGIYTLFNEKVESGPEGFASVDEKIQWVVPNDQRESPVLTFMGRDYTTHAGVVKSTKYDRPDGAQVAIAANSAETLKSYTDQVMLDAFRIDHGL